MSANKGKFKEGTQFIGNINKRKMQVVKIEDHVLLTASGRLKHCGVRAQIKDMKTGKTFYNGIAMLEHCDLTIVA